MNNTFNLGRSIAKILPFHKIPIKKQETLVLIKEEEIEVLD